MDDDRTHKRSRKGDPLPVLKNGDNVGKIYKDKVADYKDQYPAVKYFYSVEVTLKGEECLILQTNNSGRFLIYSYFFNF